MSSIWIKRPPSGHPRCHPYMTAVSCENDENDDLSDHVSNDDLSEWRPCHYDDCHLTKPVIWRQWEWRTLLAVVIMTTFRMTTRPNDGCHNDEWRQMTWWRMTKWREWRQVWCCQMTTAVIMTTVIWRNDENDETRMTRTTTFVIMTIVIWWNDENDEIANNENDEWRGWRNACLIKQ